MSRDRDRPSRRYIKHGWLLSGEYHPELHHLNDTTMDQRNMNGSETYYTPEEMEVMKKEIKIAICPICLVDVNKDEPNCVVCKNGHKFHSRCYEDLAHQRYNCLSNLSQYRNCFMSWKF